MSKNISQREARRLRKRVAELEAAEKRRRDRWASDWNYGWTNITTLTLEPSAFAAVRTARLLKHAVICLPEGNGTIRLMAEAL